MSDGTKSNTSKSIGGQIPVDLYWKFKQAQVDRHETATQALVNAIQLYLDVVKGGDEQ